MRLRYSNMVFLVVLLCVSPFLVPLSYVDNPYHLPDSLAPKTILPSVPAQASCPTTSSPRHITKITETRRKSMLEYSIEVVELQIKEFFERAETKEEVRRAYSGTESNGCLERLVHGLSVEINRTLSDLGYSISFEQNTIRGMPRKWSVEFCVSNEQLKFLRNYVLYVHSSTSGKDTMVYIEMLPDAQTLSLEDPHFLPLCVDALYRYFVDTLSKYTDARTVKEAVSFEEFSEAIAGFFYRIDQVSPRNYTPQMLEEFPFLLNKIIGYYPDKYGRDLLDTVLDDIRFISIITTVFERAGAIEYDTGATATLNRFFFDSVDVITILKNLRGETLSDSCVKNLADPLLLLLQNKKHFYTVMGKLCGRAPFVCRMFLYCVTAKPTYYRDFADADKIYRKIDSQQLEKQINVALSQEKTLRGKIEVLQDFACYTLIKVCLLYVGNITYQDARGVVIDDHLPITPKSYQKSVRQRLGAVMEEMKNCSLIIFNSALSLAIESVCDEYHIEVGDLPKFAIFFGGANARKEFPYSNYDVLMVVDDYIDNSTVLSAAGLRVSHELLLEEVYAELEKILLEIGRVVKNDFTSSLKKHKFVSFSRFSRVFKSKGFDHINFTCLELVYESGDVGTRTLGVVQDYLAANYDKVVLESLCNWEKEIVKEGTDAHLKVGPGGLMEALQIYWITYLHRIHWLRVHSGPVQIIPNVIPSDNHLLSSGEIVLKPPNVLELFKTCQDAEFVDAYLFILNLRVAYDFYCGRNAKALPQDKRELERFLWALDWQRLKKDTNGGAAIEVTGPFWKYLASVKKDIHRYVERYLVDTGINRGAVRPELLFRIPRVGNKFRIHMEKAAKEATLNEQVYSCVRGIVDAKDVQPFVPDVSQGLPTSSDLDLFGGGYVSDSDNLKLLRQRAEEREAREKVDREEVSRRFGILLAHTICHIKKTYFPQGEMYVAEFMRSSLIQANIDECTRFLLPGISKFYTNLLSLTPTHFFSEEIRSTLTQDPEMFSLLKQEIERVTCPLIELPLDRLNLLCLYDIDGSLGRSRADIVKSLECMRKGGIVLIVSNKKSCTRETMSQWSKDFCTAAFWSYDYVELPSLVSDALHRQGKHGVMIKLMRRTKEMRHPGWIDDLFQELEVRLHQADGVSRTLKRRVRRPDFCGVIFQEARKGVVLHSGIQIPVFRIVPTQFNIDLGDIKERVSQKLRGIQEPIRVVQPAGKNCYFIDDGHHRSWIAYYNQLDEMLQVLPGIPLLSFIEQRLGRTLERGEQDFLLEASRSIYEAIEKFISLGELSVLECVKEVDGTDLAFQLGNARFLRESYSKELVRDEIQRMFAAAGLCTSENYQIMKLMLDVFMDKEFDMSFSSGYYIWQSAQKILGKRKRFLSQIMRSKDAQEIADLEYDMQILMRPYVVAQIRKDLLAGLGPEGGDKVSTIVTPFDYWVQALESRCTILADVIEIPGVQWKKEHNVLGPYFGRPLDNVAQLDRQITMFEPRCCFSHYIYTLRMELVARDMDLPHIDAEAELGIHMRINENRLFDLLPLIRPCIAYSEAGRIRHISRQLARYKSCSELAKKLSRLAGNDVISGYFELLLDPVVSMQEKLAIISDMITHYGLESRHFQLVMKYFHMTSQYATTQMGALPAETVDEMLQQLSTESFAGLSPRERQGRLLTFKFIGQLLELVSPVLMMDDKARGKVYDDIRLLRDQKMKYDPRYSWETSIQRVNSCRMRVLLFNLDKDVGRMLHYRAIAWDFLRMFKFDRSHVVLMLQAIEKGCFYDRDYSPPKKQELFTSSSPNAPAIALLNYYLEIKNGYLLRQGKKAKPFIKNDSTIYDEHVIRWNRSYATEVTRELGALLSLELLFSEAPRKEDCVATNPDGDMTANLGTIATAA